MAEAVLTDEELSAPEKGDASIPRMKMGEIGYTGLKISNGRILEESKRELRWPYSINTFKQMTADATISAGLAYQKLMIGRVSWCISPPENADEKQLKKAKFIEQCMDDMEHSFGAFIKEVSSMFDYGFCINEIVPRYRRKTKGSKYDDGLVGIRKLPIRSQDSIIRWVYNTPENVNVVPFTGEATGRDLIAVEQNTSVLNNSAILPKNGMVLIPRERFLHFKTDTAKDNPEGNSPLRSVYIAWKFRKQLEEIEAVGYSRNMGGVPHLELHPRYMADDASESDKAIYKYYQRVLANLQANEQAGLITPLMYDPETKQPYFKFQLLSVQSNGSSQYIADAIRRYDAKILTALYADVLTLGQGTHGSFSLADSKTSILAAVIEARLMEIQDVLNKQLIPFLFKMNGWDDEELPKFVYGDLDERDLETWSKALQRLASNALIAKTVENVNYIAEELDLPYRVDSDTTQEELERMLGASTSSSGKGMASPTGEGTSKTPSGQDNSSDNLENNG